MRIAVISHSMVAPRQWWFWDFFGRDEKSQVMKVSPKDWGQHHVDWGYEVTGAPDMVNFKFSEKALADVEAFKPDLIYVQEEAYCAVTSQFKRLAKRIGAKFAVFVWENIAPPNAEATRNLYDADLVVCGNTEALALVKDHCSRDPIHRIQVGVNTEVFEPRGIPDRDVIFMGRSVPEKGIRVLMEAVVGTNLTVRWPNSQRVSYGELPRLITSAKVHCAPSIDTEFWREQHSSYASLEALSCGLYNATSDSACIVEGLTGCPGVLFSKQGDPESLREDLLALRAAFDANGPNLEGRRWVHGKYGYEAMRDRLTTEFERILR